MKKITEDTLRSLAGGRFLIDVKTIFSASMTL